MGYVFNDLKPDNILVGNEPFLDSIVEPQADADENSNSNKDRHLYKISMIDFGLVSKYKRRSGEHIKEGIYGKFKGSIIFASKHLFNFQMSSRRDDLIALVYVMIYMLDQKQLSFIDRVLAADK